MILRQLIKKPLQLLGLDLVRYQPKYSLGPYAILETLNIRSVIDVGAHTGEFALMIKQLLPEASVVSFEPLKREFQELQQKLEGRPGFQTFNYALGDRDGTATIWRNDYSQSSSLLRMTNLHREAFPQSGQETSEEITIRRLDDVLAPLKIDREILLKLDVQGYEDKVLAGSQEVLTRARALVIEVSFRKLYEDQPLFDDVYATLRAKGFAYQGNLYQLLDNRDGSVVQADALFLRED
jgi:FkbM family methyltransferase